MDYKIGQFRKSQLSSYMSDVNFNLTTKMVENSAKIFSAPCIETVGSEYMASNVSYYVEFTIDKDSSNTQNIEVYLSNPNIVLKDSTSIEKYEVSAGEGSETFNAVFTPYSKYTQVLFVSEEGLDITIKIKQFKRVKNILDDIKLIYSDLETIKDLGIQSQKNMVFCLNGEKIVVSNRGVYELQEEIPIYSIGFIIEDNDTNKFFILDFKY